MRARGTGGTGGAGGKGGSNQINNRADDYADNDANKHCLQKLRSKGVRLLRHYHWTKDFQLNQQRNQLHGRRNNGDSGKQHEMIAV